MMTRRYKHLENKNPTWKIPRFPTSISIEYSFNHMLEVGKKAVLSHTPSL
jgi:hypothetical protein